jgi:hypothetical protein
MLLLAIYLFIALIPKPGIATRVGPEWQILNFNLTLDTGPDNGEVGFEFQDKTTDAKYRCGYLWRNNAERDVWRTCSTIGIFHVYTRITIFSSSAQMEIGLDVVRIDYEMFVQQSYTWFGSELTVSREPRDYYKGLKITRAATKIAANSTGKPNNWLTCYPHQDSGNPYGNPWCGMNRPGSLAGPIPLSTETWIRSIEPFQVRNMTIRRDSQKPDSNCSVEMSVYNPQATFFIPGSVTPAEQQSIELKGPEGFCKGSWDCKKDFETSTYAALQCSNNFFAHILHKWVNLPELTAQLGATTAIGVARLALVAYLPLHPRLTSSCVGQCGFCYNDDCTWGNMSVPLTDLSFRPMWETYKK